MNPLDLSWIGDIFTSSDSNAAAVSSKGDAAAGTQDEPLLTMQNDADSAQAGLDAVVFSDSMLTTGQDADAVLSDARTDTVSQNEQEAVVAVGAEESQAVSAEDGAEAPVSAEAVADELSSIVQDAVNVVENSGQSVQAGLDTADELQDVVPDKMDDLQSVVADVVADNAKKRKTDDSGANNAASVDTQLKSPATTSMVGNISEQYIAKSVEDDVQSVSFGSHESHLQVDEASSASAHSVDSKAVSGLLSRLSVAEAFDVAASPGDRLGKLQSLLSESQSMARQLFLTASADAGDQFWATLDQIRAVQSRILSSMGNTGKSAPVSNPAKAVDVANTATVSAAPVFNGLGSSASAGSMAGGPSSHRSFVG